MKINHEQTKTKIIEVIGLLRSQAKATADYRNQKYEMENNTTYSQDYRQKQLDKLRDDFYVGLQEFKVTATEKMNEMLLIEQEQEKILELDIPEFSNTIALIKAVDGKLNPDTWKSIVLNFAGHYQVLNAIKNICEEYQVDFAEVIEKEYFTSAETILPSISASINNIDQSPAVSIKGMRDVMQSLVFFGETRGLVFTESEKDFGANDETVLESLDMEEYIRARKIMGLS